MINKLVVFVLFWFTFASSVLWAQGTTGTISGTVRDASGAVVPGASVTVQNPDTGFSRTVTVDRAGRYFVPQLPLGRYEVQAEVVGFKKEIRQGISLAVGQTAVVDFALTVGSVAEHITVTAEAPLVESSGATISGLVSEKEMSDLPLDGRSFDRLITTDAGAAFFPSQAGGSAQGFGAKFTVNGQRWESNKFYQDGTEILGASRISDVPGSASGLMLGVDAIREFRVLTNNYSAEYGKKVGGAILTVTKSGTNELHGSAFEFIRNNNLDARNFFDRGETPQFKRNNFGGALGGPIQRDKMFIFGNYEGLRQRQGVTNIAIVPDLNARRGILPNVAAPIPVSPLLVPYLSLFPLPDGRNFGDGTAESFNPAPNAIGEDFGMTRFDYNISDSDSFFVSYTIDDARLDNPIPNRFFAEVASSRNHLATLKETHIFSPTTLNVFHAGFNRSFYFLDTVELISIDPALSFYPGLKFGTLQLFGGSLTTGPTVVGDNQGPNWNANNLYQVSDQVIHTVGSHNFTLGGTIQRIQRNELSTDFTRGNWQFASVADLISARPSLLIMGVPTGIRGVTRHGLNLDTNYVKAWRQTYGGFYATDNWKATPNLTLDAGLRFEFITVPTEIHGRTTRFTIDRVTPGGIVINSTPLVGKPVFDSATIGVMPRFGLAWDPFGNGKTSVRGGFGIFYELMDNQYRFYQDTNPPSAARVTVNNPPPDSFPRPFGAINLSNLIFSGRGVDPNIDPATVFQYNLGIQRELGQGTVLKLTYIGSRGYDLANGIDLNLRPAEILADGRKFRPAGTPFANPDWSRVFAVHSQADAWYNSFKFELEKRLGSGAGILQSLRFKWAYSYARSIDTASALQGTAAQNSPNFPQDSLNVAAEKALSAFDIRHNVAFNFSYYLPRAFSSGLGARFFNDWIVNGVLQTNSGFPVTVNAGYNVSRDLSGGASDRPDLAPGASSNPVLGGPDRYFDPLSFTLQPDGFYGNLGRNTLIGPGLVNFDFSVEKDISLSERHKLQFRAESFNLFNRANFGLPAKGIFNSGRGRIGSAGRIQKTVTSSRQIQFGLRFEF